MKKYLLAAVAAVALGGAAQANELADLGATFVKGVAGHCNLAISGKKVACDPQMTFYNAAGRTHVIFGSGPLGTTEFSGDRDRQPDLNHYRLFVDRFSLADHARVPASGTCDTHVNDDGSRIFSQVCSVTANGMRFDLTFIPTGGVTDLLNR
jgi:hypothetical protein